MTTVETSINQAPERILRLPEVMKRTGLPCSTIYFYIRQKSFPKQVSISIRNVGWLESEINQWMAKRIASSRQQPP